ncbi:MAG: invertase, partial [Fibromonadaceae bacterium]|nr:invertase [Fibromonadaceae bacterium]
RTKEALARKKAEGFHLGRPFGAKSRKMKLTGKKVQVEKLLGQKVSQKKIAKQLGVSFSTLRRFIAIPIQ